MQAHKCGAIEEVFSWRQALNIEGQQNLVRLISQISSTYPSLSSEAKEVNLERAVFPIHTPKGRICHSLLSSRKPWE